MIIRLMKSLTKLVILTLIPIQFGLTQGETTTKMHGPSHLNTVKTGFTQGETATTH